MSWFGCSHHWRVLAKTVCGPGQIGSVESFPSASLKQILDFVTGTTTVLVCCDKCGAKQEHVMPGKAE